MSDLTYCLQLQPLDGDRWPDLLFCQESVLHSKGDRVDGTYSV